MHFYHPQRAEGRADLSSSIAVMVCSRWLRLYRAGLFQVFVATLTRTSCTAVMCITLDHCQLHATQMLHAVKLQQILMSINTNLYLISRSCSIITCINNKMLGAN